MTVVEKLDIPPGTLDLMILTILSRCSPCRVRNLLIVPLRWRECGLHQRAEGRSWSLRRLLANDDLRDAPTMRSTRAVECVVTPPTPYKPSWQTVIDFLEMHLRR